MPPLPRTRTREQGPIMGELSTFHKPFIHQHTHNTPTLIIRGRIDHRDSLGSCHATTAQHVTAHQSSPIIARSRVSDCRFFGFGQTSSPDARGTPGVSPPTMPCHANARTTIGIGHVSHTSSISSQQELYERQGYSMAWWRCDGVAHGKIASSHSCSRTRRPWRSSASTGPICRNCIRAGTKHHCL